MYRRRFLNSIVASTSLAITANLSAREPIERSGPPRFQFGLAAYSLRNYFSFMKGKEKKPAGDGPAIDMFGFIDYCVAHGFDSAELTSYFFPPDVNDDYLLRIKRHAFECGVTICGTAIGNNFTVARQDRLRDEIERAKRWIDRAAVLGAPHIRFFAGTAAELAKDPQRIDQACEAIDTCAAHAAQRGIYLGIENHGRLSAEQVLAIIRRVSSPWVGVNLDTGNFVSGDPYADLVACAPYAVNVQVKAAMKSPTGEKYPADYAKIAAILKSANYQGHIVLEYEEPNPYGNIPRTQQSLRDAFNG